MFDRLSGQAIAPVIDGSSKNFVKSAQESGSSTVTVAGAKRGQVTTAQTPSSVGVSEPTEIVWLLPEGNLAGVTPRPGDRITDVGGTVWTITNTSYSPLSQVWRAGSRLQR